MTSFIDFFNGVPTVKPGAPLVGFKINCVVNKPEPSDLQGKYPIFEITSSWPYELQQRCYSCRLEKPSTTVEECRANLGFLTVEKTKQTLDNTTQYIKTLEAETREYMCDYYKPYVFALKPQCLDDTLYVDCFFSSIYVI